MADKKITQLNNITGADLADADEFVVVDITSDETKAITFNELKTAFDTGTGFVRVTGDTMTGALNVESTITSDGMIVDGDVDVTGTVTADGLTVDGGITTLDSGSASPLVLERNGGTDANTLINFNQATEDWYLGANTSSQFVLTRQLNADVDKALSIDPNGDISFYEDTGTTAKLFWDASAESLSLGDTIVTALQTPLRVKSNSSDFAICIEENSGGETWQLGVDVDGDLNFHNSGSATPSVTFDDSGNVGIGSTDADSKLKVELKPSGTVLAGLRVGYNGTSVNYLDGDTNIFRNGLGNTEAMRIDSSQNLLVGTTTAYGTTGTTINQAGLIYSSADEDRAGQFDRTTSDGELVRFSKAGATVGSIGSVSTDSDSVSDLYIGGDNTGIRLGLGADVSAVVPCLQTTGALRNGVTNLGASDARFKDLYLSGGVVFGTGGPSPITSNTLDDYEEGTFTPSLDFGSGNTGMTLSASGKYIKVGHLVTVWIYIYVTNKGTSTGHASVGGLPFAINNPVGVFSPLGDRGRINTGGEGVSAYISSGSAFSLYSGGFDGGQNASVTHGNFQNTSEVDIVTSYFTNS